MLFPSVNSFNSSSTCLVLHKLYINVCEFHSPLLVLLQIRIHLYSLLYIHSSSTLEARLLFLIPHSIFYLLFHHLFILEHWPSFYPSMQFLLSVHFSKQPAHYPSIHSSSYQPSSSSLYFIFYQFAQHALVRPFLSAWLQNLHHPSTCLVISLFLSPSPVFLLPILSFSFIHLSVFLKWPDSPNLISLLTVLYLSSLIQILSLYPYVYYWPAHCLLSLCPSFTTVLLISV